MGILPFQSCLPNAEANAALHSGGGLPVVGVGTVGRHAISHTVMVPVTTQNIGLKYDMAPQPHS